MAALRIKKLKAGTAIFFRIETRDSTTATHPLFAPAQVPTILIRDSLGAVQVNYANMSEVVGSTGVYTYSHQTATTDALGVWQVGFKLVNSSVTVYTPDQDAFELVR